jgi:hypothetical protein
MHLAIRRYEVDPASMDEIVRHINEGFIPSPRMHRASWLITPWIPGKACLPV